MELTLDFSQLTKHPNKKPDTPCGYVKSELESKSEEVFTCMKWAALLSEASSLKKNRYLIACYEIKNRTSKLYKVYDGIYGLCYIGNCLERRDLKANTNVLVDPLTRLNIEQVYLYGVKFKLDQKEKKIFVKSIQQLFHFTPGDVLGKMQRQTIDSFNPYLKSDSDSRSVL